jgi:hypothetical protein
MDDEQGLGSFKFSVFSFQSVIGNWRFEISKDGGDRQEQ